MKKNYKAPVSRVWNVRSQESLMQNSAFNQCMTYSTGAWDNDELSVKEEEDNTVSIWDLY